VAYLVFDCIETFSRFKYGFVITDPNTRFPMAYDGEKYSLTDGGVNNMYNE